jgi:hypothetical protein
MTQETSIPQAAIPQIVPGPKILLMGDSGTGKTHAIRTLVQAGITPFIIATEQNCVQVLKDLPDGSWHYKFIPPTPESSFANLVNTAQKVNTLSYENLMKWVDPNRSQNRQFYDVAAACANYVCDCHKQNFGPADSWNTDRALVIDSLSGLSDMAMNLVVGNKPAQAQPDWNVAMNLLKQILNPFTNNLRCTGVMIGHLAREKDEVTGGTTVMVNTLGQKLAPTIPRLFSDVIRARRDGATYFWDTADTQATVVARHLPLASNLPPSFVPLIDKWKKEGGVITKTDTKLQQT